MLSDPSNLPIRVDIKVASLLFQINVTPIIDERHAKRGGNFDRTEADVQRYNKAALAVMNAEGVQVHDLHGLVVKHGVETMLGNDGTHYTPPGYEKLAEAVVDVLERQLIVMKAKPVAKAEPDSKAGEAYRKAEAARVSVDAIRRALEKHPSIREVRLVFFSDADAEALKQ